MTNDLLSRVPRAVRSIAETLGRAGFGAWVVGGCVRDLLRGAEVADWDVATSARPEDVQKLFRRTIPTGIAHGTISVMEGKERYELTTLRGEGAYTDGRRPDSVHFVGSIEEDLARRDFTVNAVALDPRSGALVDPWGGIPDLRAKVLRAVRDPAERFGEDGLRALRAARFVATLEMTLDPATEAAIPATLATLAKVSKERVLAEWQKAIEKSRAPSQAFDVMRRTGMLGVLSPPLAGLPDEVFARAMTRLDGAPRRFAPALAALLMDVGASRAQLDAWLRDLKCSSADRERALHLALVLAPLPPVLPSVSRADVRRWMKRVGRAHLDDALSLVKAEPARTAQHDALPALIAHELNENVALETKELAVRGEDLMKELGIPPSRKIGELLEGLLDDVLEDPTRNTRAVLLERARSRLA